MTTINNKEINIEWTIELCRNKAGKSQKEMAKELGVSELTYKKYENYKNGMRIQTAFKFSEIVGIPIESIIFFKE